MKCTSQKRLLSGQPTELLSSPELLSELQEMHVYWGDHHGYQIHLNQPYAGTDVNLSLDPQNMYMPPTVTVPSSKDCCCFSGNIQPVVPSFGVDLWVIF
jgi:hypothetical protein